MCRLPQLDNFPLNCCVLSHFKYTDAIVACGNRCSGVLFPSNFHENVFFLDEWKIVIKCAKIETNADAEMVQWTICINIKKMLNSL